MRDVHEEVCAEFSAVPGERAQPTARRTLVIPGRHLHRGTALALAGSALVLAGCSAAAQSAPSTPSVTPEQSFRYHLPYTMAAEVNARMPMAGEYIGGAPPEQFAGEASWVTLEAAAQQACATAKSQGWHAARAELETTLNTGVGADAPSSLLVSAVVNAATAPASYCP